MGSNIHRCPLHEEARKYIKKIRPDEVIPPERSRDLTYEDLTIILDQLKTWSCLVEGDYTQFKEFDIFVSRQINGDEGRNVYITLWITEEDGKPNLMFHKGRHSVGLFITKEIAKFCGSQCVFNDNGEIYIVTGDMDLMPLMTSWLNENLYGDYWRQKT